MKILYAIQGTGNGHLTRGMEIVAILQKKGEVDVLISGTQADLPFPFPVKYRFRGLSFIFGKKGGIDVWKTYVKMNSRRLLKEIKSFRIDEYDLIISDFEPVSAWAANLAKKPCIALSNQVATLHPLAPKPKKKDIIGKLVLKHYAPCTYQYGFHFKALDNNIFTPVIRGEVRRHEVTDNRHYTVYLPSYDDKRILKHLGKFKTVRWEVFTKHNHEAWEYKNVSFQPISSEAFLSSMASSSGVICNAGFGTASEALFLKKKLLVIPMKGQYEQKCNAQMLKSMGVPVLKKLKKKHHRKIQSFIDSTEVVEVDYPDITEQILDTIIENHAGKEAEESFRHSKYSFFR
jgi:uncharacterized protein (TIGR00661 family)